MNTRTIVLLIILGVALYFGMKTPESEPNQKSDDLKVYEAETAPSVPIETAISFPAEGDLHYISDIINENDVSLLKNISYEGRFSRKLHDARLGKEPDTKVFLFNAFYKDGGKTEFWVNPEFGDEASAKIEVEKYAKIMGQLPAFLRKKTYYFGLHKGNEIFEGRVSIIYIYTDMTKTWEESNLLEEVLIHETSHAALFLDNDTMDKWYKSQNADDRFITKYAEENSETEDMAESFMFYIAAKYRGNRLEPSIRDSILATIPNRIKFFDNLNLDMHPFEKNE